MTAAALPAILCVDDEPNVLEGLNRRLRRHFAITTAVGGEAGLEALQRNGPFAVVVSDLRMPGMDGVRFLRHVRQSAPETVRVLLTGHADLEAAIAAVNEGHVFRFLTKPCPAEVLLKALGAAVEQHRLVTAERVLLQQTLHGSVKTLTDLLALIHPAAFGRAMRLKHLVSRVADNSGSGERWQIEVASMLSQIGCVTLPPQTADKLYRGEPLSESERAMAERLPAVAEQLLANIPRLEQVRAILAYQSKRFDGSGPPFDGVRGEQIPWGARVLRVVSDFDILQTQGVSTELALATLRGRAGWYDPAALQALAEALGRTEQRVEVRELGLRELRSGMVFAEDVWSEGGVLLIARGQEVTASLLERIRNFSPHLRVREPIRVILPAGAAAGAHCGANGG